MDLDLQDETYVEMVGLEKSIELLDAHLKVSRGERTMSDEDVKLSIVALKIALDDQMKINRSIIARLEKLEKEKTKKPFWKI